MELFDDLNQPAKGGMSDQEFRSLNPEAVVARALEFLENEQANLRASIATDTTQHTELRLRYEQAKLTMLKIVGQIKLAKQEGNDILLKELMIRQEAQVQTVANLKADCYKIKTNLCLLYKEITKVEAQLSSIHCKKDRLIKRVKRVQQYFSTLCAFERMEARVLQMEARSQAVAELAGADLESQFASLESGSDVDEELALMKEKIQGHMLVSYAPLSPCQTSSSNSTSDLILDTELEDLKRQLDSL
jgi:phage shock protein A